MQPRLKPIHCARLQGRLAEPTRDGANGVGPRRRAPNEALGSDSWLGPPGRLGSLGLRPESKPAPLQLSRLAGRVPWLCGPASRPGCPRSGSPLRKGQAGHKVHCILASAPEGGAAWPHRGGRSCPSSIWIRRSAPAQPTRCNARRYRRPAQERVPGAGRDGMVQEPTRHRRRCVPWLREERLNS